MDNVIGFILERIIYPVLIFLKRRNYVIPVDTTKNNIIRQNVLVNILNIIADWICAVLVLLGWEHNIVTYVSLMTIAIYTFVGQFEIYSRQRKYLNCDRYICEIKLKQNKYLKKYTPNIKYMIFVGLIFVFLIFMAVFEGSNVYILKIKNAYKIWVVIVLLFMMYIKTKYIFLDLFDVDEFTYKNKDWKG